MTRLAPAEAIRFYRKNGMSIERLNYIYGPSRVLSALAIEPRNPEPEPDVAEKIVPSVYKEHRRRAASKAEAAARRAETRKAYRAKMKAELAALRKAHALRLEGRA